MKSHRAKPDVRAASSTPQGGEAQPSLVSNQDLQEDMAALGGEEVGIEPGLLASVAAPPSNLYVLTLRSPPPTGVVADLTAGGSVDATTEYVKLDASGPLWLHIAPLSGADRAALVQMIADANGQFSINAQGRLVLGVEKPEAFLDVDEDGAQAVLDGANSRAQDADVFDFLNGEEQVLFGRDADDSGFDDEQTKPGAWYNGYTVTEEGVEAHKSRFDDSGRTAPELDEQGLRDLVMRCLDISQLRSAIGDNAEVFEAALVERFHVESGLSPGAFSALCRELWSYFLTGAGTDGEIDIGRLQAVVRAIAPEIKTTAETNTPFKGDPFAMGDVSLKRGDGKFGRATMLSLLHLFGDFHTTVTQPPDIGMVPSGTLGDHDHFMIDSSPSMMSLGTTPKWPMVQTAVDGALGSTPGNTVQSRTQGTFNQARGTVGGSFNASQTGASMRGGQAVNVAQSLDAAYQLLCPKGDRVEQDAFADLFGVSRQDIFSRQGQLDTRRLMGLLGDGTNSSAVWATSDFGGKGESPIKAMLYALTHPSVLRGPLKQRIAQGKNDTSTDPVRLNGVMDESFQGLEYLEVVKALGKKLNVDLRFIIAPFDGAQYANNPISKLVFVDADAIVIDPTLQEAEVTYEQGGQVQKATFTLGFPNVRGTPPAAGDTDRFRGATLDVGGFQRSGGVTR